MQEGSKKKKGGIKQEENSPDEDSLFKVSMINKTINVSVEWEYYGAPE